MMFLPAVVDLVTLTLTTKSPTRTMSAAVIPAHAATHLVSMMMTPAAHEMNLSYSDTYGMPSLPCLFLYWTLLSTLALLMTFILL